VQHNKLKQKPPFQKVLKSRKDKNTTKPPRAGFMAEHLIRIAGCNQKRRGRKAYMIDKSKFADY
jgi:hypothetical protein